MYAIAKFYATHLSLLSTRSAPSNMSSTFIPSNEDADTVSADSTEFAAAAVPTVAFLTLPLVMGRYYGNRGGGRGGMRLLYVALGGR